MGTQIALIYNLMAWITLAVLSPFVKPDPLLPGRRFEPYILAAIWSMLWFITLPVVLCIIVHHYATKTQHNLADANKTPAVPKTEAPADHVPREDAVDGQ